MKGCDEQEILLAIAKGDEKAFRALFNAYHQKLGVFIYRLTKDVSMAEDLVQEVFIKIWKCRNNLPDVKSFDAYLFKASRNLTLNALRDMANRSEKQEAWEKDYLQSDRTMEADDLSTLLDEAIDMLPMQQKKVYVLSKLEKYKYVQIAEQMNISRETVKKYLQLAKHAIMVHMKDKLELFLIITIFFR